MSFVVTFQRLEMQQNRRKISHKVFAPAVHLLFKLKQERCFRHGRSLHLFCCDAASEKSEPLFIEQSSVFPVKSSTEIENQRDFQKPSGVRSLFCFH